MVVSAVNENVVTNGIGLEISSLMQCIIEEADQKVFVHVEQCFNRIRSRNDQDS